MTLTLRATIATAAQRFPVVRAHAAAFITATVRIIDGGRVNQEIER